MDMSTDGRTGVQWKYTSETLLCVVVNRTRADKATPGEREWKRERRSERGMDGMKDVEEKG